MKDPDPEVRRAATNTLRGIGSAAHVAVPDLTRTLRDKDPWVQCGSADALGVIGSPAEPAAASLVQLMRIPIKEDRIFPQVCAAEALMKISATTRALVPAEMIERVNEREARLKELISQSPLYDPTRPKEKEKPSIDYQ